MKKELLTGAALLLALSPAAFAQTTAATTTAPAVAPMTNAAPAKPAETQADAGGMRKQLIANLKQAGFTNVKVMADSFLVQATDKSGNPVTMFLNPDSMTVFSEDSGAKQAAEPMAATGATGMFTSIPARDDLSSKVVGLDIYNNANQDIGTIKDIAFDASGVKAYIVGVGGFLGVGDHYVAIRPSAINLTFNAAEKKWHAKMDTNADQLKAAPEYKYASNF
jgi:hypothetical protein